MKLPLALVCVGLVACSRNDEIASPAPDSTEVSTTTITSAEAREPDSEITRKTEIAIAADPSLSFAARNVEIDTREGIVTLLGSVDDLTTKQELERFVDGLPNAGTLDKLEISPSQTDTEADDNIAYSLERTLTSPSTTDAQRVTIDVHHGLVTLRGETSTATSRAALASIAKQTPGVIGVKNDLAVHPARMR